MSPEYHRRTTVKPGGHIEVSVPQLREGQPVEVVVRCQPTPAANGKRPGFGSAGGLIKISDDFDKPLADFSDCQ